MKRALINVREFFWPLLEKDEVDFRSNENQEAIELNISDENLEEAFKLKSKIFDAEEDRRKSIESKAALFISTISIATSLVVAANTLITSNNDYSIPIKVSVIISFILSVYGVRTVWFSIKTLERGAYDVLNFNDINFSGTKPLYYKHLIQELNRKVIRNQSTINRKVDFFTLAQEYYKRAIILICIYSLLVMLFCLFFSSNSSKNAQFNKNIELVKPGFIDSNVLKIDKKLKPSNKDTVLYKNPHSTHP